MEATKPASNISIYQTGEEVARAAADRFVDIAAKSISNSGRFSVALAGGSTPKRAYELLASKEYRDRVAWPKVHLFFGDERAVPPTHRDSNYRMASEALISHVPIPAQNVHRMLGEGDVVANASLYEDDSRNFFEPSPWPRFDLVLLGMGEDGHTASLFPGTTALREREVWVTANWVPKINAYRITLTSPTINNAANILFLVTGASKSAPFVEVLRGPADPERLPAQLIQPINGTLLWLVDKAAAVRL